MKKKFKAKVSGMFDIVQLGDDTFSEVVNKLKANDYHIDQQFTSREECYIEAIGDGGTKCVSRGDMVFTDETGELFIMSEKRFNATQRMKKWKKIQKSLIRKWRQTLCDWFGHQPVTVIEERWRGKQNILSRKGGKPRKGGHYVTGHYQKCRRCGKKLSNFARCW